jgi:hypothetical protein
MARRVGIGMAMQMWSQLSGINVMYVPHLSSGR